MRRAHASFPQQIAEAISKGHLLQAGQSVLIAMSGGPDSVCLGEVLRQLGYDIALAHVNYGLRGEDSDADEALVRSYATRWRVPCHVMQAASPPPALSLQAYARQVRYAFFEELMDTHGYQTCATGHHRDDEVETLLWSLLRSRHPQLWQGIPKQRGRFVRPLLQASKQQILTFLAEADLTYRIDQSNLESAYLRNQIRNEVLPSLQQIHPEVETQLLERSSWYQLQYQLLRQVMAPYLPEDLSSEIDWRAFEQQYGSEFVPLLVAEVLLRWGLGGAELMDTLRLIDSRPGAKRQLPQGILLRTRQGLTLLPETAPPSPIVIEELHPQQSYPWGSRLVSIRQLVTPPRSFQANGPLYLDQDRIQFPLVLRSWKEGDRMQPLGMKGSKKLSDIFIDEQYGPQARQQALVIADQERIIALSDFRISERVRLGPNTQRVLQFVISPPV